MSRLLSSPADLGILAFIDEPAWILRRHLRPLLSVMLPARLLAVVPSTIGQVLTWGVPTERADIPRMLLGHSLTLGGIGFSMAVLCVGFGALAWTLERCLEGRPHPPREALRWALQPGVGFTILLVALIVALGSLFCVVPGLFAGMLFAPVLAIMAVEGTTGGAALDRAMALSRHGRNGPWFTSTTAWALVLTVSYGLVNYAVGSLVTLPAGVVGGWYGIKAASEGMPVQDISTMLPMSLVLTINLSGAFLYVLADLYLVSACSILYRRARDLTEGRDLAMELGVTLDPAARP